MEIVARGAEAVLKKDELDGETVLIKERIKKGYRIEQLDKQLRMERTVHESKLLGEARRAGVDTPKLLAIDEKGCKITMEWIEGQRLKEMLNSETNNEKIGNIAELVGNSVGRLHAAGITHGDLTTSNMIISNGKIYFIDFGLGFFSSKAEDHGTDLAVFKEAVKATHFKHLNLVWDRFIKGYKQTNAQADAVLKALADIEKRGRYITRVD
ncbi:MAG: KEOPS complex kinase/ATPase Bud32 [Candidatus Aenigmatarchaeota archaeon]|nr:Kae1-associated serine/threonine protein kinase [Candidatus Aenigmarchaeota archaeon]